MFIDKGESEYIRPQRGTIEGAETQQRLGTLFLVPIGHEDGNIYSDKCCIRGLPRQVTAAYP